VGNGTEEPDGSKEAPEALNHMKESKDYTESIKLGFESVKQQTTLSAGSIVIIGTFLKDIFSIDNGTLNVGEGPLGNLIFWLIVLAFVAFGVSLVSSSIALSYYSRRLWLHIHEPIAEERHPHQVRKAPGESRRVAQFREFATDRGKAISVFSLNFGLISFGAAVVLNLW
jgi:hypothetical protein